GGRGAAAPEPVGASKVVLVRVDSGEKTEFEGVRRFAFSGEAATHLALHKTPAPVATGPAVGPPAPDAPARSAGADLVLPELATGNELTLGNVAEFAFDKQGRWLALAVDARDQLGNGLQLRNMTNAALLVLDSGKANYQGLAWTEKGDGLTALKGIEDKGYE